MNPRIQKLLTRLGVAIIVLLLTIAIQYVGDKTEEVQQASEQTNIEVDTEYVFDQSVLVTRIVDGDTVYISNDTLGEQKIRLIGIQAPEIAHPTKGKECLGEEARYFADQMLAGKSAVFSQDITQDRVDIYDRLLGYLSVDGVDYSLALLKEGLAREYTYSAAYTQQSEYRSAQADARAEKKGLWSNLCAL